MTTRRNRSTEVLPNMEVVRTTSIANPLQEIRHIDEVLSNSFVEYSITKKHGTQTIVGKTAEGQTVKMTQYIGNGVKEQTISTASELSVAERRVEAKRLYTEKKLSQQAIADQLGFSQKTISDDLREIGVSSRARP
jgi:DNA-binding CsgD family transcriptional regulator